MVEVQQPDVHAALASPVRRRVLDELRAADGPCTAHDLAERVGLHVTTLRFHLGHLEQAGLVAREVERTSRPGRPSVRYRAVMVTDVRERMIDALAGALLAPPVSSGPARAGAGPGPGPASAGAVPAGPAVAAGPAVSAAALAAGREWADQLPLSSTAPEDAITSAFARLGFDPEPADDVVRLRACPFREAARRQPQAVCAVHLGLAQRLAERAAEAGAGAVDPGDTGPDGEGPAVRLIPFVEPELCLITLDRITPDHRGRTSGTPPIRSAQ